MKKVKPTYLLFIGVIVIWIFIGWRIIKVFKEPGIDQPLPVKNTSLAEGLIDSLHLILDYEDPFLGRNPVIKSQPVSNNISDFITEPQKPKPRPNFPRIEYKGMFYNKSNGKKIALLNINRDEVLISEGEKSGNLLIKKIYDDSIAISSADQVRIFLLE